MHWLHEISTCNFLRLHTKKPATLWGRFFLIFLVLELDKADRTKEEQLRAIARQRAVWDYNTDIITAQEEGLEEGMKIFLRSMIETRFGQPFVSADTTLRRYF